MFILFICLVILGLFRVVDLTLGLRGDTLLYCLCESSDVRPLTVKPHERGFRLKLSTSSVLLGHLYKGYFPGESNWVIHLRAILAVAVVLGILIYGFLNIIIWPLQENKLEVVREHRSLTFHNVKLDEDVHWGVVASMQMHADLNSPISAPFSAITVEMLPRRTRGINSRNMASDLFI
ncbi:hypothetical protein CPB83DRAFT_900685 [Crepidotus variabilis]|uniref:Uncharacterized protein n=1 Tax=Crepidotus variabilis TaxID=179855 RepID=A0A9P6BCS0_9AGAR|nr:hypothetical protein CPB83DRAFT_900685 [Crepidotus variabilis]